MVPTESPSIVDSMLHSEFHVKQCSEISKSQFWHLIHVKKIVHQVVMQRYWSHIFKQYQILCGKKGLFNVFA